MTKIAAAVGSHGTGKTTTLELVQALRQEWSVRWSSTRHTVPITGYKSAYDIADDIGIGNYELMMLNQWCTLDPTANPFYRSTPIATLLLDRSPLDHLAYYYLLRNPEEQNLERILVRLATYYMNFINCYVFFPTGRFSFSPDDMQTSELQIEHERELLQLARKHNICLRTLESIERHDRTLEFISIVESIP